jgi:hypothetical protein
MWVLWSRQGGPVSSSEMPVVVIWEIHDDEKGLSKLTISMIHETQSVTDIPGTRKQRQKKVGERLWYVFTQVSPSVLLAQETIIFCDRKS